MVSAVFHTVKLRAVLVRADGGPHGKAVARTLLVSWFVAIPCARVVAYNATVGYQSLAAVLVAAAILLGLAVKARHAPGFDGGPLHAPGTVRQTT